MGRISDVTSEKVKGSVEANGNSDKMIALSKLLEREKSDSNCYAGEKMSFDEKNVYLNGQKIEMKIQYTSGEQIVENYFKEKNIDDKIKEIQEIHEKYEDIMEKRSEVRDEIFNGNLSPELKEEKRAELKELRHETTALDKTYNSMRDELYGNLRGSEQYSEGMFITHMSSKELNMDTFRENEIYQEGWKVHISIKDENEYIYTAQRILPELINLDITHKIIPIDDLQSFNESSQQGKGLTLYCDNIMELRNLPDDIKEYLSFNNGTDVLTDINLGGKVYARYSGFEQDKISKPDLSNMINTHRQEGDYKPDWIPEPPTLQDIFDNKTPDDERAYLSRYVSMTVQDMFAPTNRFTKEFEFDSVEEFRSLESDLLPNIEDESCNYEIRMENSNEDGNLGGKLIVYSYDQEILDRFSYDKDEDD